MIFTNENIKYCLLTWDCEEHNHIETFSKKEMTISGLYNWANVFSGDRAFPRTKSDFSAYNLIHINLTVKNLPLLAKILPLIDRNKTKVIINVDYAIELWTANFSNVYLMLQELDKADYIFAVEETMAELLSKTLKRNVPCIPHPSPTHFLEKIRTQNRIKKILTSIHRYDNNIVPMWFALKNGLPNDRWITSAIGAYTAKDRALPLFDEVQDHLNFETLMEYTSQHYAVIESYMLHSYGRFTAECACLGVPCIGPSIVGSIKKCFPDLTTEYNNPLQISKLLSKLINNKDFYSKVAKKGIINSEYYSFDNCRKLMINFLNSPQ